MSPYQFTDARSLFEAAFNATQELTRSRNTLQRMESMEGARGANVTGVGHASGIADPYAPTDARMDYERRIQATIEEDEALVDYACSVLYGTDQTGRTGGLYTLAPRVCADVICLHWCMGASWEETARMVGYSTRYAQDRARMGFEIVDAYGIEATIEGKGGAT